MALIIGVVILIIIAVIVTILVLKFGRSSGNHNMTTKNTPISTKSSQATFQK